MRFVQENGTSEALINAIEELQSIDTHYLRKENLFFPYLEQYGITAPPKVMWGVDDEIRLLLNEAAVQWPRPGIRISRRN